MTPFVMPTTTPPRKPCRMPTCKGAGQEQNMKTSNGALVAPTTRPGFAGSAEARRMPTCKGEGQEVTNQRNMGMNWDGMGWNGAAHPGAQGWKRAARQGFEQHMPVCIARMPCGWLRGPNGRSSCTADHSMAQVAPQHPGTHPP